MSPPSAIAGDILHEIDPNIWRGCAGASIHIPTVNSRVYYFPQGHIEHCCPSISSSFTSSASPIVCLVSSVELLADPVTDEVFAYLHLQPMTPDQIMNSRFRIYDVNQEVNKVATFPKILTPSDANNGGGVSVPIMNSRFGNYDVNQTTSTVTTFAKILTPSDANNGGGFSVPRFCADSIFPPLDFDADPPVQKLFITDIHGFVWEFRHVFRGTPRRHLLTTGWSKFVNGKKLIAGDSVVFMKKSVDTLGDQLFVGVRRTTISIVSGALNLSSEADAEEDDGTIKKFRRSGKGKLTGRAVSEAINRASQGLPFEVAYYPTSGWSEFVVRAEDFEASMTTIWCPGIRVKMAMETDDSSRITWFQGTISYILEGSPWKQLQIIWDDEPEILEDMKRVNPWQVEVDANSTQFLTSFSPTKRPKYPHFGQFSIGGEGDNNLYLGRAIQPGNPNPNMFASTTTLPVGIQGARHYESASFNQTGLNPLQLPSTNNFFTPESGKVSNFNSPPSGNLSPSSNITDLSSGNRDKLSPNSNNATKGSSIRLFGKNINVQEVRECSLVESGLNKEEESKETSNKETQLSLKHDDPQEPVKSVMCKGCECCRNLPSPKYQ